MIKKNQEIEIDENDIFKNDKLDRKDSIEDLSKLIISNTEPLVLSINASWGSGKTTFVKLWQTYLKKECNVNSIYFSAWEDDFSKEPLISILGEIKKYINEEFYADPKVEESFEKVKNIGGKVLKRGIPAFLKGITAGVVDFDKGFEEALGAIAESSAKELIDNYSKDKEITIEFKNSIEELLSKINNETPFVIFIDELDRCRPLYSIELLERIKHIFGIKKLIFVLSIDKSQLSESIKSQYGNIDTDNYLRRFIDLEYYLNTPKLDDFCYYLYNEVYQFNEIFKSKNIKKEFDVYLDELSMIKYLTKSLDFSLREIEQLFIQLNIIFSTVVPRLYESHFRIIVLFVILKMKLSNEYELLKIGKANMEELTEILIDKKIKDESKDLEIIIKAVILSSGKDGLELNGVIKRQKEILDEIDERSSERYKQEWLVNLLEIGDGNSTYYKLNQAIETVIKKVEFVDKFNFETV